MSRAEVIALVSIPAGPIEVAKTETMGVNPFEFQYQQVRLRCTSQPATKRWRH